MHVEGDFSADGYAVIRRIASAEICEKMVEKVWADLRSDELRTVATPHKLLTKPTIEVRGQDSPSLTHFHWALTAAVEAATGLELLPSYCHFRLCWGGDILRVHSDRVASQVSLSLTLGYSDGLPWEIRIGTRPVSSESPVEDHFGDEPSVSVMMQPGDALLYRGAMLRHGRLTPNPNKWSAHLFAMWVERGGEYESLAFERLAPN